MIITLILYIDSNHDIDYVLEDAVSIFQKIKNK